MENTLAVRKAHMDDVKSMHGLLLQCAQKGLLLPRALIHLYGHVRNFMVAENAAGEIVGCCALAPIWEDLAEICVFCPPGFQGCGQECFAAKDMGRLRTLRQVPQLRRNSRLF